MLKVFGILGLVYRLRTNGDRGFQERIIQGPRSKNRAMRKEAKWSNRGSPQGVRYLVILRIFHAGGVTAMNKLTPLALSVIHVAYEEEHNTTSLRVRRELSISIRIRLCRIIVFSSTPPTLHTYSEYLYRIHYHE